MSSAWINTAIGRADVLSAKMDSLWASLAQDIQPEITMYMQSMITAAEKMYGEKAKHYLGVADDWVLDTTGHPEDFILSEKSIPIRSTRHNTTITIPWEYFINSEKWLAEKEKSGE